MELKAGTRLRSTTDGTEVVVVCPADGPVDLRCGGHPMVRLDEPRGDDLPIESGFDQRSLIGKRYVHEETGVELLCTKAGHASLSLGTEPVRLKAAKPLPSSD